MNKDQLIDFDQLFQDVNVDLRQADSKDRPFLRYISLGNRFTAGVCADASLDKDRDSLTKMLAHQAGLAHAAAFKLMDRAMEQENPVEMTRLVNASGRMMAAFQQAET